MKAINSFPFTLFHISDYSLIHVDDNFRDKFNHIGQINTETQARKNSRETFHSDRFINARMKKVILSIPTDVHEQKGLTAL